MIFFRSPPEFTTEPVEGAPGLIGNSDYNTRATLKVALAMFCDI